MASNQSLGWDEMTDETQMPASPVTPKRGDSPSRPEMPSRGSSADPLAAAAARPARPDDQSRLGRVLHDPFSAFDDEGDSHDENEDTLVDLELDAEDGAGVGAAAAPARARMKWGRWVLLAVALVLVVGIIGALIAENYARSQAEGRIAQALGQGFNTQADVSVRDSSVLWSLTRNRLEEVSFSAENAKVSKGDTSVTFMIMSGDAAGIVDPKDPDQTVINSLQGSALIEWAELSRLANEDIRPADKGRIRGDRTVKVLGAEVPVQITARPVLDPSTRKVLLRDPEARATFAQVPQELVDKAIARVAGRLVLPELPALDYESLQVTERGVEIRIIGKNVPLSAFTR